MFSKKGMKPDPKKIQEIQKTPVQKINKSLQRFLGLSKYMKRFIIHKHIIYENYYRRAYRQENMSKLLTILNNLLTVKVMFPIFQL